MKSTLTLPYVWDKISSNTNSLPELLETQADRIKEILRESGAVLFKSFEIDNPTRLEACVNAFPGNSLDYVDGNSPRTKLQGKVYTSTEHPAEEFISLHNEMSYAHQWPSYLFFCCAIAPKKGGCTIVADSRTILADLSPATRAAFREKGVEYIRNLHGGFGAGPSWQDTFETDQKEKVEAYCRASDTLFSWNEENGLRLTQKRKAIIRHPYTNEEVWFNQADQFHPSTNTPEVFEALMAIYEEDPKSMPQYATFSEGEEIPLEMLEEIRTVAKKNTVSFPWEQGDLMLVDNVLAAHGRSPFEGPRKILVSMSA